MKQTAVEWLINELQKTRDWQRVINEVNQSSTSVRNVLEQAKKMEKEQIMGAWVDGNNSDCLSEQDSSDFAEQYYNETFNTNEK